MRPEPTTVRVVLAEDGVLLREGLAGLLGRFGFEVAAAVGDAEALRAAVAEHTPDPQKRQHHQRVTRGHTGARQARRLSGGPR